ncbi:hypothetical protein TSUD_197580 [Trifolium subterraneum]|uniref:Uncharacterized protein n=1 Tax=Trifolium subterraneum TaxID=3900 RepID=A0A2Z6M1B8_TRISU|nr:hypothetical protein TSUD_197580 [Trifolium subterraneum]
MAVSNESPNHTTETLNHTTDVNLPPTAKNSRKSGLTHSLTIKLDEKNFLLWNQQVNGVITAHNLHRFVVNPQIPLQYESVEDRLDGKNSDEYQQWLFKDQSLFTWLLSTISDDVLPRVLSCKHSYEVWEQIHKHFNSVLKSRSRQLRSELKNTKKMARSVNEYLIRIKSIVNSLIAVGDVVSDKEQVEAVLEGLPKEFSSFVMMIYSQFATPKVKDVEALLLLREVQFEKFRQELANPRVSANTTQVQSNFNDEAMDTETQESGTEHYNVSANRGKGRGKGRGRGRGRASNPQNSGKVQCQICGKLNHDALNCWHRYEPQSTKPNSCGYHAPSGSRPPPYNPYARPSAHLAVPQYFPSIPDTDSVSSASWYPDFGASHHLTFNPNNFAHRAPYQGPDQVMMGNGQGAPIQSLGHSQFYSPVNPKICRKLSQLLHVPNITKNLLSVSKFAQDNNVVFEFHPYKCYVKSQGSGEILLEGNVGHDDLYQFKPFKFLTNTDAKSNINSNYASVLNKSPACSINSLSTFNKIVVCNSALSIDKLDSEFHRWHLRLDHAHNEVVQSVLQLCKIPHSNKATIHFCPSCCIGKSHRQFAPLSTTVYTKPFEFQASIKALQSDWGGVSPQHKGHKCLDEHGKIYVSKDVVFHESQFPYSSMFPNLAANYNNNDITPTLFNPSPHISLSNPSPDTLNSLTNYDQQPITPTQPMSLNEPTKGTSSVHSSTADPTAQPPPPSLHHNDHSMVTRVAEFKALIDNNTWSLVPLPPHKRAIGCKWVFRVKENVDGTINKYKACLVAKGFLQTPGFDFTETFSSVIKAVTVRLILTLAVTYKWSVKQIDINNDFLNGLLQEEVYMTQPTGFESSDKSLVCKLHKSLYGLKQAPRAWFERLTQTLLQMGFAASKCDPSLLVHHQQGASTYVLIYVDDILITGSSSSLIEDLINKLHIQFALKQLGEIDYFLGIEVHHMMSGALLLSQSKFIKDLLIKTNMGSCNPIGSTTASSCRLSKHGTYTLSDPSLYMSIVGSLQYATLTKPDIAFSVNKVCQYMAHPLEPHWTAVKRILKYLQGTTSHGLLLSPSSSSPPFSLRAYSDPDWATNQDDRRSISRSCIYFGPNLISWGSKKQPLVAHSSTEAEYRSMANTTAELLWIQSLLKELEVPYLPPTLLCDNLSAVSLAHNPVLHSRTKHIELDIHFVREKVLSKQLQVLHVPASEQLVDPLTKSLSPSSYTSIQAKLKVFPYQ